MANCSRWVYRFDKLPKDDRISRIDGKIPKMTNGAKTIFVESRYTDRKLGLLKKGVKKRHIKDTTK